MASVSTGEGRTLLGRAAGIHQERSGGHAPTLGKQSCHEPHHLHVNRLFGELYARPRNESLFVRKLHGPGDGMYMYSITDSKVHGEDIRSSFRSNRSSH